jgi:hypothetical protein
MACEAKSVLPWLGWAEESDTGDAEQIGGMKHTRIHAEEEIAAL